VRKLASYRDRTAVVTGASSGIGRVLALRLAREGARVALVARCENELEKAAREIHDAGGRALVLACDVGDRARVERAAERALSTWGSVDLLVNNAGYGHHKSFLEWSVEDMERMMRVNYLGSLYWTKALLPSMVGRGSGWIVFVASVAGKIAPPEESAYAATKHAMVALAEALSIEVEDAGVHVLTVCPGTVRTPFFDAEALDRMPPVARRSMVEPEPLVDAVVEALARGRREITYPPSMSRQLGLATVLRALAPEFARRQIRRSTLDAARAQSSSA
jgi:short-subunit dehydrogenase